MTAKELLVNWADSQARDADVVAYYLARVSDPREAMWRAVYTRMYARWEQAEDAPWRDHPSAVAWRSQARTIKSRWQFHPLVGGRWAELDRMRIDAEDLLADPTGPEYADMPNEPPRGMDPISWRSHLQAYDLTDLGRWPATSGIDHEGTKPMTTNDAGQTGDPRQIESETEQQMRADFMHAQSCVNHAPEDYDPADSLDFSEYAGPWLGGNNEWTHEWLYLSDATERWRENRADAEHTLALHQRANMLSPIEIRSEEQARYIAEHGIERDEAGLLTSHYATRVDDRIAAEVAAPEDTYINRYVARVQDPNEVLMRADFDRLLDLRGAAAGADTDDTAHQLSAAADHINGRWAHRNDDYSEAWSYLFEAKRAWSRVPEEMQRYIDLEATDDGYRLTSMQRHSHQHARQLTGNGTWDSELYDSESQAGPLIPASSSFARARATAASTDMPGAPTPGMHQQSDTTYSQQGAEPMTDVTRAEDNENSRETQSRYPDLPPVYEDPSQVPMTPGDAHWLFTGHGYTSEHATRMVNELAVGGVELTGDNVRDWMNRQEHRDALQEQARYRYRPEVDRQSGPAEQSGTSSPLADYRPGNAVTAPEASCERDGIDR
ncbi:hypothetical protein [Nocardia altamirensis]|uniref:hypothetical protein n=1 Tax=Nocardia altamirensis TaxID=472158 RepID=UPI00084010B7|nr:hypothetical protein [Nocardia altamirensis]